MTPGETVVVSCAAVTAFLLAAFLAAVSSAPAPRVILRLEERAIVCAVPPAPENRWVELSIDDEVVSGRSLDGERDVVVLRRPIPVGGCEGGETRLAGCRLTFMLEGRTQYAVDRRPFLCRPFDPPTLETPLSPSRLAWPVLYAVRRTP